MSIVKALCTYTATNDTCEVKTIEGDGEVK